MIKNVPYPMQIEQLFSKGEYMVVYLYPTTAVYQDLGYLLWNKGEKNIGAPTLKNTWEKTDRGCTFVL